MTPDRLQAWLTDKAAAGWETPSGERRPYTKPTLRDLRADAVQLFGWAIERRYLDRSPADLIEIPNTAVVNVKDRLTREQWLRAIDSVAASRTRYAAYILLLLTTGMRPGEAAAIRPEDVDEARCTVRVERAIDRTKSGVAVNVKMVKTKASVRTLAIPPYVVAALRAQRKQQMEERLIAGRHWHQPSWAEGLLFLTQTGAPPNRSQFVDSCEQMMAAAGVPRITPYEIRHTVLSAMVDASRDVDEVVKQAGHRDQRMIYHNYLKREDAPVTGAVDLLASLIPDADSEADASNH